MKTLSPETKSASSRSRVRIDSTDGVLTLEFRASDTSALRAVVNSYLNWVLLVSDTFSRLESLQNERLHRAQKNFDLAVFW
jgi:tRNA threonylcarbamoyladenosine modification (KEOPS) complex  Pcc1 subunit